ncbi:MAG TPA: hypothetical protein VE712_04445 [Actinomycetota bacterium]|jgi:hypothetical protein|nr:hypothetical protein [Actinomycetota bacterium]
MDLIGLMGVLAVLYVIAGTAALFGADSRDGDDPPTHRHQERRHTDLQRRAGCIH